MHPEIEYTPRPLWHNILIRSALIFLAAAVVLICILSILWGLKLLLGWFGSAIWPVMVAMVLSLLLKPIVECLEVKARLPRGLSISLLYVLIIVFLAGMLWFLVPFLMRQISSFADFLPSFVYQIQSFMAAHMPRLNQTLMDYWDHFAWENTLKATHSGGQSQHMLLNAFQEATLGLFSIFEIIVALVVTPIYLFYFLLSPHNPTSGLENHLSFVKTRVRQDIVFLVEEFTNILVAFFRGQILIGLIVAVILSSALSLAGLKFGAVLGLTIGLTNILPYVGTVLGLTVALPIAYFQPDGGLFRLGLVLCVFFVSHLFEAYVLSPKIMGERTGLHPAAIIFSLFFWGTVFQSPLGVLLAIPLSAFWVVFWRLLRRRLNELLDKTHAATI